MDVHCAVSTVGKLTCFVYAMETFIRPHIRHRPSKSGVNARKKDEKSKKKWGLINERNNNRAFGVSSLGKTKRSDKRNLDRMQKKEIVGRTNRTEKESPPPICVVVMVCTYLSSLKSLAASC